MLTAALCVFPVQGVALVARDVSTRLLGELNSIEEQFLQLSEDIKAHRWATASRLSGTILITARSDACGMQGGR